MSIPRTTDVSKHLARKPKRAAKMLSHSASVTDTAQADLKFLSEDLSEAVRGAQKSRKPGSGQ